VKVYEEPPSDENGCNPYCTYDTQSPPASVSKRSCTQPSGDTSSCWSGLSLSQEEGGLDLALPESFRAYVAEVVLEIRPAGRKVQAQGALERGPNHPASLFGGLGRFEDVPCHKFSPILYASLTSDVAQGQEESSDCGQRHPDAYGAASVLEPGLVFVACDYVGYHERSFRELGVRE